MKKVLGVGLVLGVACVLFVAGRSLASPERRACTKLHEVCGGEASASNFEQCTDVLERTRRFSGDAAFNRSVACIDESASCSAAAGCLVGGAGVGAVGEFMKGFGSALSR